MTAELRLQDLVEGRGEDALEEARRQLQICNSCRYCEGFCDVFPALTLQTNLTEGDVTQFANLCHNCRGCYYSCQYVAPHEFDLNLPKALAQVRAESWEEYAWPRPLARVTQKHGATTALAVTATFMAMFLAIQTLRGAGTGFYAYLSHVIMVTIFLPAFLLPGVAILVALYRYWQAVGGKRVAIGDVLHALGSAARLRNLDGGQGQGCNFEKEDRYTNSRRYLHQAVMYGFLLCVASTVSGTVIHYLMGLEAPYGFWSAPKLFGVSGGILLTIGGAGMLMLKGRADPNLGTPGRTGGEIAFIVLLLLLGITGLALYAATGTALVGVLLALHLGAVLAFFLLAPYSKMVHAFFRFAALMIDAQKQRANRNMLAATAALGAGRSD